MNYINEDLNSIITKYQNYLLPFDKAKWEQNVEERILHKERINHIPKKSAKLQSYDLIDLDLVRGSSFSKAKPKHGLFKVIGFSLLRFFFLPAYSCWWINQTSKKLFFIFTFLYSIQFFNVFLYVSNISSVPSPIIINATTGSSNPGHGPINNIKNDLDNNVNSSTVSVQLSEILSPIFLMVVLTILHSQIVATQSSNYEYQRVRQSLEKRRSSGGSGSGSSLLGKSRNNNKRRLQQRFPHSRRRSSGINNPIKLQSKTSIILNSNNIPNNKKSLLVKNVTTGSSNEMLNDSPNVTITFSSCKRVIFEDQSKASVSSNSDKDEGIAEEIVLEDSLFSNSSNENTLNTNILESQIIQKNLAKSLKEINEESNNNGKTQLDDETMENNENQDSNTNSQLENNDIFEDIKIEEILERRPNLRKRHASKQSESSCPSCGNETSSEDDLGARSKSDFNQSDQAVWTAVTTNSEDDDYEEEDENHSEDYEGGEGHMDPDCPFAWEFQKKTKSGPTGDLVSCTIWEGKEAKKADLTVLDISSTIIAKVECARENSDYLYFGIFSSLLLAFLPSFWRINFDFEVEDFYFTKAPKLLEEVINSAYGFEFKIRFMIFISAFERLSLSLILFFILAVAEKTYKQRFLYAKLFSRLTSSRKAKKSGIPHFRLNKVRNIKTWLSVRSYLQKRGPQRSIETIVSATFIAALILIFFLSVELLKDSNRMYYLYNVEVIAWSLSLGIFLMRFMTLGSRISQKYRNLSVIITEQLNLYLKMEQKPHKKEELLVANNVLKTASKLLKELEDPFKISSFATNPYLYNVTRLVILSAFSGVLSEMLGFKLKLYKIKIK